MVEKNKVFRSRARERRTREFFYGNPRNALHPHSCEIKFSNMKIFKIGIPFTPNSMMNRDTLDLRKALLNTKIKPIVPGKYNHKTFKKILYYCINNFFKIFFHDFIGPNILNHVLALSFSTTVNEYVPTNNVAGFVCV